MCPLEVGDDYPAGVDQNVRHHLDPPFSQDVVGLRCRGMVRRFHYQLGPQLGSVLRRQHVADGGGHQDFTLQFQKLVVGYVFSPGESGHDTGLSLMLQQSRNIQALGVVNTSPDSAYRNHLATVLLKQPGGPRAHIAESLNHDTRAVRVHVHVAGGLVDQIGDTSPGCRIPSQ